MFLKFFVAAYLLTVQVFCTILQKHFLRLLSNYPSCYAANSNISEELHCIDTYTIYKITHKSSFIYVFLNPAFNQQLEKIVYSFNSVSNLAFFFRGCCNKMPLHTFAANVATGALQVERRS